MSSKSDKNNTQEMCFDFLLRTQINSFRIEIGSLNESNLVYLWLVGTKAYSLSLLSNNLDMSGLNGAGCGFWLICLLNSKTAVCSCRICHFQLSTRLPPLFVLSGSRTPPCDTAIVTRNMCFQPWNWFCLKENQWWWSWNPLLAYSLQLLLPSETKT